LVENRILIGGIEGGGTKFKAVVVEQTDLDSEQAPKIIAEQLIATTTPEETIGKISTFFQENAGDYLQAVGLACFGPLDLNPESTQYGHITKTTKPGWSGADVRGMLNEALQTPVVVDTDVNGAALGEYLWGVGRGFPTLLYLTVGTGIGGGLLVNGEPHHGLTHPEMGHIRIPHNRERDPFPGACKFHGNCLEGLAAGYALEQRWGARGETLPPDHPAWELEAEYLGSALANYALTFSPQRIILGGGIMQQTFLYDLVRNQVIEKLNGYIPHPAITEKIEDYIVPPGLGNEAGVLGAVGLTLMRNQS
jgi:fructokinase